MNAEGKTDAQVAHYVADAGQRQHQGQVAELRKAESMGGNHQPDRGSEGGEDPSGREHRGLSRRRLRMKATHPHLRGTPQAVQATISHVESTLHKALSCRTASSKSLDAVVRRVGGGMRRRPRQRRPPTDGGGDVRPGPLRAQWRDLEPGSPAASRRTSLGPGNARPNGPTSRTRSGAPRLLAGGLVAPAHPGRYPVLFGLPSHSTTLGRRIGRDN